MNEFPVIGAGTGNNRERPVRGRLLPPPDAVAHGRSPPRGRGTGRGARSGLRSLAGSNLLLAGPPTSLAVSPDSSRRRWPAGCIAATARRPVPRPDPPRTWPSQNLNAAPNWTCRGGPALRWAKGTPPPNWIWFDVDAALAKPDWLLAFSTLNRSADISMRPSAVGKA